MANEQQITVQFTVAKGGAADGLFASYVATLTGTRFFHNVQLIGTSEEALALGDVTAGGVAMFKNLDATNPIAIKAATGATPLASLKAGECALFRLHVSATAPFAQATTGSCLLEYIIAEN